MFQECIQIRLIMTVSYAGGRSSSSSSSWSPPSALTTSEKRSPLRLMWRKMANVNVIIENPADIKKAAPGYVSLVA